MSFINPLLPKGGGGLLQPPPHFCFVPLTFLHLTLWRPISNFFVYKSKRYKTVVKVFFQGVIPEIRREGCCNTPPPPEGEGEAKKIIFFLGLG